MHTVKVCGMGEGKQKKSTGNKVLREVRAALGFSQPDVRRLIHMADPEKTNCEEARKLASDQLDEVGKKIRALTRLRGNLTSLIERCDSQGTVGDCPLIDSLLD